MRLIPNFLTLITIVLLIGCSNENVQPNSEESQVNYDNQKIDLIIDNHLDKSLVLFQDSIDATSGFLGWRNIRDYLGLGREGFRERTLNVWNSVYDSETLALEIEHELETDKPVDIQLTNGDKQIATYIHKISLSTIVLIGEVFFDFLLEIFFGFTIVAVVVFVFVAYQFSVGGWIRWSKKRHERVDNLMYKGIKWAGYLAFVVAISIGIYNGDFSTRMLTDNIKENMKEDINAQVEQQLNNQLK